MGVIQPQIENRCNSESTARVQCFVSFRFVFVLSKSRIHCDLCRKLLRCGQSLITLCSLSAFLLFKSSTISLEGRSFKDSFCYFLGWSFVRVLSMELQTRQKPSLQGFGPKASGVPPSGFWGVFSCLSQGRARWEHRPVTLSQRAVSYD